MNNNEKKLMKFLKNFLVLGKVWKIMKKKLNCQMKKSKINNLKFLNNKIKKVN